MLDFDMKSNRNIILLSIIGAAVLVAVLVGILLYCKFRNKDASVPPDEKIQQVNLGDEHDSGPKEDNLEQQHQVAHEGVPAEEDVHEVEEIEESNLEQQHQVVHKGVPAEEDVHEVEEIEEEEEDVHEDEGLPPLIEFKEISEDFLDGVDISKFYAVKEDKMVLGPFKKFLSSETNDNLVYLKTAAQTALTNINARIATEVQADTSDQQKTSARNAVRIFEEIINFPYGNNIRDTMYYKAYKQHLTKSINASDVL